MLVLKDVLRPRLKPSSSRGEEFQPYKYLTDRNLYLSKTQFFEVLIKRVSRWSFNFATTFHMYMFDYCANPVVHFLILKSFTAQVCLKVIILLNAMMIQVWHRISKNVLISTKYIIFIYKTMYYLPQQDSGRASDTGTLGQSSIGSGRSSSTSTSSSKLTSDVATNDVISVVNVVSHSFCDFVDSVASKKKNRSDDVYIT